MPTVLHPRPRVQEDTFLTVILESDKYSDAEQSRVSVGGMTYHVLVPSIMPAVVI